jgi:hypothetical protein
MGSILYASLEDSDALKDPDRAQNETVESNTQ